MSGTIISTQKKYPRILIAVIVFLISINMAEASSDMKPAMQEVSPIGPDFSGKATGGWHGYREQLERAGISINAQLVPEGFANFRGGQSTSKAISALTTSLTLDIDTEKFIGWDSGRFLANLTDHVGENPSTRLIGDLQVFDNFNTKPFLQIFELWYDQIIFKKKLRVKVGKVDANTNFSVIDNGLPFLNSSSQVNPALFLFPTTPDPMPSVNVFYSSHKNYYISFGAYYANRSSSFGNFSGSPQDVQPTEHGAFLIGETGLTWQRAPGLLYGGNLKFGFWGHTGNFTHLDGTSKHGTHGYYLIYNQTLWRPNSSNDNDRSIKTFLSYGRTQNTINVIDWNFSAGLTWTGMLSSRPDDMLGFGPDYAHIVRQAGLPKPYELAIEMFYSFQVIASAKIKPDLQYIINPGGRYRDSLVGSLRVIVDL